MTAKTRRQLFVLLIAITFFTAIEVGSRVILHGRRFTVDLVFANETILRRDDTLGWALNPNVLQRVRINDDYLITYRTNSLGYRGDEARRPVEVIFAGDSYTFGMNSDTSYPEEFRKLTGAEIMNTAVVGYGTDQAFLSMKRFADAAMANPEWIVYGFYPNDLRDNASDRNLYAPYGVVVHKPILNLKTHAYLPADTQHNDMTVELRKLRNPRPRDMVYALLQQSRFLWAAEKIRASLTQNDGEAGQINDSVRQYLDANLAKFDEYARMKGARFAIVHIPDRFGHMEKESTEFLQAFSNARDAIYIRPELEESDYIPIDGHLSDAGARRIANALAAKLGKIH
jgi:hypothetical protein